MFGFFKGIKQEFADLKAKFEALEAKVEGFFTKDKAPAAPAPVETQTAFPPETPVVPEAAPTEGTETK